MLLPPTVRKAGFRASCLGAARGLDPTMVLGAPGALGATTVFGATGTFGATIVVPPGGPAGPPPGGSARPPGLADAWAGANSIASAGTPAARQVRTDMACLLVDAEARSGLLLRCHSPSASPSPKGASCDRGRGKKGRR